MAEFTVNNNDSVSTKLSPFFASKGLHSRINFDIIDILDTKTRKRINKTNDIDILKNMHQFGNMYKNL